MGHFLSQACAIDLACHSNNCCHDCSGLSQDVELIIVVAGERYVLEDHWLPD